MKIFTIAPYPVLPAETGGRIRIAELAAGLAAAGAQVTVAAPVSPRHYRRKQITPNLTMDVVPYPFIGPVLLSDRPFPFMYLISVHPGYGFLLRRFIKNFDIILFEQASFGDLIGQVPANKTVVYNAHNVESDYVGQEGRWDWVRTMSRERIGRFENQLARRADLILTCSERDAVRIGELAEVEEDRFSVVPNGVNIKPTSPAMTEAEATEKFPGLLDFPQRAIFSGSDVEHNRAAVRFLLEEVAPKLQQTCAFIIRGQCGFSFAHQSISNVFFDTTTGGNVGPYAKICTAALQPVMQGSGTSLKVLDYLSHGLPLVSTDFGMRGFDDLKPHVTLAEPADFAQALSQEQTFSAEGRQVLERYSWKSVSDSLYQDLLKVQERKKELA